MIFKSKTYQIVILILCSAVFSFAQSPNSSLSLTVVDQQGNSVSNFSARLKYEQKTIGEADSRDRLEAVFTKIAAGLYTLEIAAEGFEQKIIEIEVKPGANELSVVLEIAGIVENVTVEQNRQEKAVDEGFSNFLTDEQIAALPDDPREMEAALKRLAGNGDNVIIRVDGFSGGRLPPKSKIAAIRIVRSSFDAEHHQLGAVFVDVVTKVGSRQFSGSVSFNFNDEALNARNPLAVSRFPQQDRNGLFFLSGPIVENKTDFSITVADSRNLQSQNVVAFLPDGEINKSVNGSTFGTFFNLQINHNLTKNLPIKLNYEFSTGGSEDVGVGGFDLPEKSFNLNNRSHDFRFSTVGNFAKKYLNEFRFQYKNEISDTTPNSSETAIIVLNSFNGGGAGNFQKSSTQSFRLADNLLFGIKQHALKIGGELSGEFARQESALNQNGTYIFTTLEDFELGRPQLFSQIPDLRIADLFQIRTGLFIQDDMRIGNGFVLSFGVRYELQNNLADNNNFSPRLAFSWSPFPSGKTTFRGGIGIFYNWIETSTLLAIKSQDENQPGEIIILNPAFPNPLLSGEHQILPPSFLLQAENLKNPENLLASFGFQHRFSNLHQLRVEYVFQKGIHQLRSRDINAPIDGIRPNVNFGRITQIESSAFFVRNAVNVGYNGNLFRNTSFTINYTLSKTVSDSDGIFSLPSDNYDLSADRSAANNDRRHRLSAFLSWQIIKGLRLSGAYNARSALPYTVTTGFDDNLDTTFNDRPIGFQRNTERGDWLNRFDLNISYIFSFLNRKNNDSGKAYTVVTTASETNSGFDFTDPEKRFSIKLFANIENIFNQTNLQNFIGVRTSPLFRQAITADEARKITLGLRFNF